MAISMVVNLFQRRFSTISSNPLCVCVVGSGPAGFYTAEKELPGVYFAREFVWWYDGHPDYSKLEPDLRSTDTTVILGQGNVALDVAPILLRPTVELATTDIASQAVAALEKSCVRKVYVVGRRGPVHAACTAKELRELLGIKGLSIHINEADLVKTPHCR